MDGPPVVLLHGYPEFWYAWYRQMGRLARPASASSLPTSAATISPTSRRGSRTTGSTCWPDDIAELIETLGYDKAFVAAHDWGGGVAWQLAIRHPGSRAQDW